MAVHFSAHAQVGHPAGFAGSGDGPPLVSSLIVCNSHFSGAYVNLLCRKFQIIHLQAFPWYFGQGNAVLAVAERHFAQ